MLEAAGHKLALEEQHQICEWFAQFYDATHIVKLVKERFDKTIAHKNIWAYSQAPKWKPLIERLRQQWAISIMDVPMAHKRTRLEKLVSLLERTERMEQSEPLKIKQAVELLREMREEMEVGKTQFTNVYMTTIHNYTDEELVRRRDEVLGRLKLLGRHDGTRHDREITVEAVEAGAETPPNGHGQDAQGSPVLEAPGVLDARDVGTPAEVHGGGAEPQTGGQEDSDWDVRSVPAPLRHEAGQQGAPPV